MQSNLPQSSLFSLLFFGGWEGSKQGTELRSHCRCLEKIGWHGLGWGQRTGTPREDAAAPVGATPSVCVSSFSSDWPRVTQDNPPTPHPRPRLLIPSPGSFQGHQLFQFRRHQAEGVGLPMLWHSPCTDLWTSVSISK